jgi:hypothetical protein
VGGLTSQRSEITTDSVGGQAGSITIETTNDLTLTDSDITSAATKDGSAGDITLRAEGSIDLQDSSSITVEAVNGGGGKIEAISGTDVSLNGGSLISSATIGNGAAGSIIIAMDNALNLQDASRISSSSAGAGDAGSMAITSRRVVMQRDSEITATSKGATGGNITFNNQFEILMGDPNAPYQDSSQGGNTISATASGPVESNSGILTFNNVFLIRMSCCGNTISAAASGSANGGNIEMLLPESGGLLFSPRPLIFYDNDVIASAKFGDGGRINIRNLLVIDPTSIDSTTRLPLPAYFVQFHGDRTSESDFISSSEYGVDGTIEINVRDNLESEQLPEEFAGAPITDACAVGGAISEEQITDLPTFIITGRGGMAESFSVILSSDRPHVSLTDWPTTDTHRQSDLDSPLSQPPSSIQFPAPCLAL